MNTLSAKIKKQLEKFNGKNGAKSSDSSPFFVSKQAYNFSGVEKKLPDADMKMNNKKSLQSKRK